MGPARLSVVVAVSRGREYIARLLRDLEAQGETGLELVLVFDDEPGDRAPSSPSILVRSVRSPSRHPCVKRNAGAAAASSREALAFLDDDAAPGPGWAAAALRALEGGADLVTGPSDLDYGDDPAQRAANAVVCSPLFSLKSALRNRRRERVRFYDLSLCNLIVRRAAFEAVGGFNEVAYYWIDDAEFCHVAERLGLRLVNEPGAVVAHRKRPVVWPLARQFFLQRWHAGLSTWSFPELYLPQLGVVIGAALLPATLAALLAFPGWTLGFYFACAALLLALGGPGLLAGLIGSFLGFWSGLLAGPLYRLLHPAPLCYKAHRYRDRRQPEPGPRIRSSALARAARLAPYRSWLSPGFPQWLIYFVTARCNARCPMCFYLDEIEAAHRDGELTVDEVARVARSTPRITYLSLSGGEPFLRDDLEALVQAFVDGPDPACVSMPTNGSLPERVERTVEALSRRNPDTAFDVHLSLDGPPEVHDRIRGARATYGRVMEVYERVSRLAAARDNVGVKFVVTCSRDNVDALGPFLEELAAKDCDRINLLPLHGNVRDKTLAVPLERYRELSRALHDRLDRRGYRSLRPRLLVAAKRVIDERLGSLLAEGDLGRHCEAGRRIAVLGPYGDVLPCEPLRESVGNVRDFGYDLPRVLAGDKMRSFAERRLGAGKCHCDWGCAIGNAVAQNPSFYPAVALEFLKGCAAG